jgi:hypothetical protein
MVLDINEEHLNFFKNNIGTDEETPLYQSTRGTTERPESRSRTDTLACVVCFERSRNVIFSCNHVKLWNIGSTEIHTLYAGAAGMVLDINEKFA